MNTERRVGFFLAMIGTISLVALIIRDFHLGYQLRQFYQNPSYYLVLVVSIFFIIISIQKTPIVNKINGAMQFFLFLIFAIIAILENYISWDGLGMFTLTIVLGINYGYFKKYRLLKMIIMFSLILFVIKFATIKSHNYDVAGYGFEALIFMSFFFGIMFLCYYDGLNVAAGKVENLSKEKKTLVKRMKNYRSRIQRLQQQINKMESIVQPFDLTQSGLTKAEMKVLETLVLYRAGNGEIADRLNKSEDTVKIQMKSIFDKIGADDRYHVMEICRFNFK